MIYGIDVSHWQGTIDWQKVATTGVKFAFIKATEGSKYHDVKYIANFEGARSAGILTGAYHFLSHNVNAAEQALYFLQVVRQAQEIAGCKHPLPLVLDCEEPGRSSVLRPLILDFLAVIEKAGFITPIIYTSPGYWRGYIGRHDEFLRYPLWVANYRAPYPQQFYPWLKWSFWQYSEKGAIPGIAGSSVDLDLFNGSLTDLLKLAISSHEKIPNPTYRVRGKHIRPEEIK